MSNETTETTAPDADLLLLRQVAAEEGVDVRSLQKRIRGEHVRGVAGARCDRAIAKLQKNNPGAATNSAGANPEGKPQ
jgi:hypothetical protein